jgi:shikimate dehydrogenase
VPPITGTTRLAAVIGDPVRHSLSPAIHNAAFRALGLDWVFLAFEVAPGHAVDALSAMRTLGIAGYSVTMPHKTDVARAVDELDDDATALGAVNCVVNDRGRLWGANTDGEGFLRGLRHDAGLDAAGLRCVVLGAGGAARAVVRALARAGAEEVVVVNRSAAPAEAAIRLGPGSARVGDPAAVGKADLVVNATPIGMHGRPAGELPCPVEGLHAGQVVVDLVYDPLDTPLLVAARARGAAAYNGVSMLVFQAARAFELWTGAAAPVGSMMVAVAERLGR